MTNVAVIDMRELSVTPFFKYIEVENVPKSETAGYAVMETKEVVEVRIAGDKNYAPTFPVGAQWKREGLRVITFAERWPEQYAAFCDGNAQEAMGTPLEMLGQYGITPEAISFCRALKIYSIEALASLEGSKHKALGMRANVLKDAANKFMADRMGSAQIMAENQGLNERLAMLEAEIASLRSSGAQEVPEEQVAADTIDAYAAMTDDELRDAIAEKAGTKPHHRAGRATLVQMAADLEV